VREHERPEGETQQLQLAHACASEAPGVRQLRQLREERGGSFAPVEHKRRHVGQRFLTAAFDPDRPHCGCASWTFRLDIPGGTISEHAVDKILDRGRVEERRPDHTVTPESVISLC